MHNTHTPDRCEASGDESLGEACDDRAVSHGADAARSILTNWPMAAGPASRLGSIEPGEKTGLRLSPTPST